MPKFPVSDLSAIPEGGNKAFEIAGHCILICRTADRVFAVENRCSHNGSPLEGGRVRGHALFCPVHGARFDLRDGSTAGQLTTTPIRTFPAELSGGTIFVQIEKQKK
jgi:3-phenylpropionate/trans-cinnamate dioxygenase ferredoxin subunit